MISFFNMMTTVATFAIPADLETAEMDNFVHESCPGYQLDSVNPNSLGLDKVKQQAGYLGTPTGNKLFYWYFESRNDPKNDPVVVWLNGGPGCSSLEAVLFENGPANIELNNEITYNHWSWNSHANMLYIDNPSGVGYSTGGATVTDTIAASEDFKNAIRLFYHQHPELVGNKFHIAGESYAGRYIPVFASAINRYPESPVNVTSVLIGNGLVNPVAEYESYGPMLCGQGGISSVLSENECQYIENQTPACINAMKQCMNNLNNFQCNTAQLQCNSIQRTFRGRNPYDIRDGICARTKSGLCYAGLDNVQDYFNNPTVRRALGVDNGSGGRTYQLCNNQINADFYRVDDPYAPTYKNVTALLEEGTAVLAYHGDTDIILNWLGGRQWTAELPWTGQAGFQEAGRSPIPWNPTGSEVRGEITNFNKFTFLRVGQAGHMVPHDQPESAYYMIRSWLNGDYAFKQKFD